MKMGVLQVDRRARLLGLWSRKWASEKGRFGESGRHGRGDRRRSEGRVSEIGRQVIAWDTNFLVRYLVSDDDPDQRALVVESARHEIIPDES